MADVANLCPFIQIGWGGIKCLACQCIGFWREIFHDVSHGWCRRHFGALWGIFWYEHAHRTVVADHIVFDCGGDLIRRHFIGVVTVFE